VRKPTIVCHCDWSKPAKKRWLAKAVLNSDGRYTAYAPERVGIPGALLSELQAESGSRCRVFVGFDFAIGVPVSYAERVGAAAFRDFLLMLGEDNWKEFFCLPSRRPSKTP